MFSNCSFGDTLPFEPYVNEPAKYVGESYEKGPSNGEHVVIVGYGFKRDSAFIKCKNGYFGAVEIKYLLKS